MKNKDRIHLKIEAKSNSVLEKAINQFIHNRNKTRKCIQEEYNKKVEKQIKKIEHGGL